MPVSAVRLVRLQGHQERLDLVLMVWVERIEDQVDVDLLLLLVDDIVGS